MPLSDYAHWNEDAVYMWWMEEGRHPSEPPEPDDWDDRVYEDDPGDDDYEPDYEEIANNKVDQEPPPGWEP